MTPCTARRLLCFSRLPGCRRLRGGSPWPIAPMSQSGELVILTVNSARDLLRGRACPALGFRIRPRHALREGAPREARVRRDPQPGADRPDAAPRAGAPAAAALPRHFDFPGGLAWGPSYLTTQHQIVGRAADPKPKSLKDIAGKRIGVIDETVGDYLLSQAADALGADPPRAPRDQHRGAPRPGGPRRARLRARGIEPLHARPGDTSRSWKSRSTWASPGIRLARAPRGKRSRSSPPPCRSSSGCAATAP